MKQGMIEMETAAGKMTVCAVLLAAGSSSRMGSNKMLFDFNGKTPIELCLEAFSSIADEAVIAVSRDTAQTAAFAAEKADIDYPVRIVMGGARRQDSVYNAINATDADVVSIHDCARCLVTPAVITSSIDTAAEFGSGIASVRPVSTLRRELDGEVVDRDSLLEAQTPQSFDRQMLLEAYDVIDNSLLYTDDAAIFRAAGNDLHHSMGSKFNLKLTTREDFAIFKALLPVVNGEGTERKEMAFRIGFGEDTHRLEQGRKLILGGVEIPFEYGLLGHSDADVLTHAVIDAVLGACAMGDIGQHFPDSDPAYKGVCSLDLARTVCMRISESGCTVNNIDATIVCQRPKLAQYRDAMRGNLAECFGVSPDSVSVKFTTPEHTGPEGRGESITARAVASVI
ncbi:MAG: 2-C-methyl-D-erythritol 2,4-cyclodiphosphate synthase [Clostridia bacterium]|nr:2-C-methyl-D-erythritol 2,4-cyclodiphosphate synthase [Clostridia bacterium]